MMQDPKLRIGMLVFPRFTQLDFAAPFEVFSRLPNAAVDIVWKTQEPVRDPFGLTLLPTSDFAAAGPYDVLFVPGGPGQTDLMLDEEVLGFLRRQAETARWVTSVCTGSLVLAAAGLLRGYRATSHWLSLDQLALFGAEPVRQRVVIDRNRVTGAGVTSGIDFALVLASEIAGQQVAETIALQIEYDPAPPFPPRSTADSTDPLVAELRAKAEGFQAQRLEIARRAAANLMAPGAPPRP
ncbi:DJ-1/PfpI family protein [Chelatococcus sp. GCM10030263]|uniref:DJ-1/PfpI family protein n=1 Tax=Chelatococcus sp. GCM10030263 TaxID=3273387 RepID=UPI00360F0F29